MQVDPNPIEYIQIYQNNIKRDFLENWRWEYIVHTMSRMKSLERTNKQASKKGETIFLFEDSRKGLTESLICEPPRVSPLNHKFRFRYPCRRTECP